MFRFGGLEIVIVLLIVLLLFGPGRIGKLAGELGQAIKNFRKGISGEKDDPEQPEQPSDKEPKQ